MKKTLLLPVLTLLLPLCAHAGIYKWVDENGNTVFSDQPRDKAEKVPTAPTQTFRPEPAPAQAEPIAAPQDAGTVYSALAIISPAHDAAIRDNSGNVTITLAITPALDTAAGHYMTLVLDGKVAAERVTSTSIALTNLDRGTHTVQAHIKNAGGATIRASDASVFHLQRVVAR